MFKCPANVNITAVILAEVLIAMAKRCIGIGDSKKGKEKKGRYYKYYKFGQEKGVFPKKIIT